MMFDGAESVSNIPRSLETQRQSRTTRRADQIVEEERRMKWPLTVGVFLAWPLLLLVTSAQAKDVTAQVIKETDLDDQIAAACKNHCRGNKRKGTLTRVTVVRSGADRFTVRADASLLNRHDPMHHVTAWSYTIDVQAYGTLDERTCDLRIDRINVRNDRLGLRSLASGQEGKVHQIKNCRRFLSGL